jgi:hypothetical protein
MSVREEGNIGKCVGREMIWGSGDGKNLRNFY